MHFGPIQSCRQAARNKAYLRFGARLTGRPVRPENYFLWSDKLDLSIWWLPGVFCSRGQPRAYFDIIFQIRVQLIASNVFFCSRAQPNPYRAYFVDLILQLRVYFIAFFGSRDNKNPYLELILTLFFDSGSSGGFCSAP